MTRGFGRFLRQNTIGLLALFLALGGTTYAASTALIGKNSVASPQVVNGSLQAKDLSGKARAALKGNRGPRGFTGPKGAAGSQGVQGVQGIQGIQGPPGPFPDTFPAGKTLVGNYAVGIGPSGLSSGAWDFTSITFDWPFTAAPSAHFIGLGQAVPAGCTGGTPALPKAAPGNLCVFESSGTNRNWFFMEVTVQGTRIELDNAAAGGYWSRGSWAATAPVGAGPTHVPTVSPAPSVGPASER